MFLQRIFCHRSNVSIFQTNLREHIDITSVQVTHDGGLDANESSSNRFSIKRVKFTDKGGSDAKGCWSKGGEGIWDYDCYTSIHTGAMYNVRYCSFYKKSILAVPTLPVNKHCADAFNWYCSAISEAGIYNLACTPHCGGTCKRTSDGHDYNKLGNLNGGTISDWFDAKLGHRNAYQACMQKGSIAFCKAVKLLGKYEADCVERIPHRDSNDDYCTCQRLGSTYYDGQSRTYRCNERQDPNNIMDKWDNECLRECHSAQTLGWMCTPTQKLPVGHSVKLYRGKLKPFGYRPSEVLDTIKTIQTAKKTGQPGAMGFDGKYHVVREDSRQAIATIKEIEEAKRSGLTIKMNPADGNPTFHSN